MNLPPGIIYMSQRLHQLLLPPLIVYHSAQKFQLPAYAVWIASFLSLPFAFALGIWYTDLKNYMNARANGAELSPRVRDGCPGSISLVLRLMENFRNGYPGELFTELAEKYGNTYNMRTLHENRIYTTEPEYIKAILATQFESFEKGPVFNYQFKSLLGSGVFNADGELWKFHRAMARPFFTKERITDFDIFDSHAEDVISQMKRRFKAGYPVDMQDAAYRFTMDSATSFLFGRDVCSLAAGLVYPPNSVEAARNKPEADIFAEAFADAQRLVGMRSRLGKNWPLAEFWKDATQPHMEKVKAYIDPIIDAGIKERAQKNKNPQDSKADPDSETFLHHLLESTQDHTILREQITNILIAGRDTTAHTITFAVYMLAEHPHVLMRLREEIKQRLGDARPTYADVREMKYLRAIINETMRLYPAVPFNVRTTNRPVIWPSLTGGKPIFIPANTRAQYSVFWMHRRTDLWGPDAYHFDPDRFIDDRLKRFTDNPWMFLPFNGGPRICLGQQFAYNEASFFLIRLLQTFSEIKLNSDAQPAGTLPPEEWKTNPRAGEGREKIRPGMHLTMYSKGGMWMNMKEGSKET